MDVESRGISPFAGVWAVSSASVHDYDSRQHRLGEKTRGYKRIKLISRDPIGKYVERRHQNQPRWFHATACANWSSPAIIISKSTLPTAQSREHCRVEQAALQVALWTLPPHVSRKIFEICWKNRSTTAWT